MADRGDVVAPGWSIEPVGALIELDEGGGVLGVLTRLTDKGKPQPMRVPKWFSRSGTGSTPNFLWDNPAYVLGLGGGRDPAKTARDHAAFRKLHLETLAGVNDPGLSALARFLEAWTPDPAALPDLTPKLQAFNISFRFEGEEITRRAPVADLVERLRTARGSGAEGFCLVRGERLPLVTLHPKIKGVDGTASAEVPLVSFNAPAFESYGQEQGANAPTSELAAFRYGAALNQLLTRGGGNRLRLAEDTVVFWADGSGFEAQMAETAFRQAFDEPEETPEQDEQLDQNEAHKISVVLHRLAAGRPDGPSVPDLLQHVRFHVLGLSPNVARLSVRFWVENRFERFADALDAHAEAIRIEPAPWRRPPSVRILLARSAALLGKFDSIPLGLSGEVAQAVLTGSAYPRTWLATVLVRLHAGDDPATGWHAAALKACLSRMPGEETPPVALNPDEPSQAYQLGRLFAVLEAAQYAALGRVNATIKDKYFGAASATPARVFGTLMRGAETHISDAKKRNRGLWIDAKLTEIVGRLEPELPTSLRLEDQARFAIGYYHERGSRPAKTDNDHAGGETAAEGGE